MIKTDYYDNVNKYPDTTYQKLNGEKVVTKKIRLNSLEAQNWDVKEVHNFLQNKTSSLEYLRFLNDFFKNNIEYLLKNEEIDAFIEEHEEIFNNIEVLVK